MIVIHRITLCQKSRTVITLKPIPKIASPFGHVVTSFQVLSAHFSSFRPKRPYPLPFISKMLLIGAHCLGKQKCEFYMRYSTKGTVKSLTERPNNPSKLTFRRTISAVTYSLESRSNINRMVDIVKPERRGPLRESSEI